MSQSPSPHSSATPLNLPKRPLKRARKPLQRVISPFAQLPPEMLSEIASQIASKQDLISFARVNRVMYTASKRYVYQTIEVDLHDYYTTITPSPGSVFVKDGVAMDGFAAAHLISSVLLKQESAAAAVKSLVFRGAGWRDEDEENALEEGDQEILAERLRGLFQLIARLLTRTPHLKKLRLVFPLEIATPECAEVLARVLFAHQSTFTFSLTTFETSFLVGPTLTEFLCNQPRLLKLCFRHQCAYIPHFDKDIIPTPPSIDPSHLSNLSHVSLSGEWSISYLPFLATKDSRIKELVLDITCGLPLASSFLPLLSEAPLLKKMAIITRLDPSMGSVLETLPPISLQLETLEFVAVGGPVDGFRMDLSLISKLHHIASFVLFKGYVPSESSLKRHFSRLEAPVERRRYLFLPPVKKTPTGKIIRGFEVNNRKAGKWSIGASGGCVCCGH